MNNDYYDYIYYFYLYIQVGVFLSSSHNSLLTESLLRTSTMVKPLNCSSARMSCVVPVTGELTFKSNNQELNIFFFFGIVVADAPLFSLLSVRGVKQELCRSVWRAGEGG